MRRTYSPQTFRRLVTTLRTAPPPSDAYLYTSFLQNAAPASKEGNLHRQAFSEIEAEVDEGVDLSQNGKLTWSSRYGSVTRQPFAKDLVHLQSLLDALLSSKNFERADKILKAIYPLSTSTEEFMFHMNAYLEKVDLPVAEVEKYLAHFRQTERLTPNDRTYAILLTKAINEGQAAKFHSYLREIKKLPELTKKVLTNIDVLGIDNLTKIFEDAQISEKHIPEEFLPLYRNNTTDDLLEDYFSDDKVVPTITKEAEELKSVDSFGLKVIRHTLLGLKLSSEGKSPIIDDLVKNLEKDLQSHVIHNFSSSDKRDYFALYKLLKTDKDKQKFNEALDLFNQARQRTVELRGADSAKEKWKHDYEEMQKRGSMHFGKSLNVKLYQWYQHLLPYVEEEVKQCQKILSGEVSLQNCQPDEKKLVKERSFYAPYLTLVPPEKMCALTILELLRLNSTGGVADGMRTARALIAVGKAIEIEYKSLKLVESEQTAKKIRSAREWNKILKLVNKNKPDVNEWDNSLHAKVGSVLISFLIHVAKVPVKGTDPVTGRTVMGEQPAFFHTYQYVHGQKLGVLKLHKYLVKHLSVDTEGSLIQPHFIPMLTPPRPWKSYNEGGYLYSSSLLVRTRDSPETIAYLKAASQRGDLQGVFDGLNVLGDTAWTVNRRVLEVMTKFWNTGEEFLDIPPIVEEPDFPPPVAEDAEPEVIRDYQRQVRKALAKASAFKSQRCDTNYKLEIARAFIGERMFFPHNIDFRGRAYPLSPHFNHLGSDLTRSLFLFWDGKELGEKGLWWLKVHLANLYGVDKVPLEERAQFTDKNLEKIRESAENPAEDGWWAKAEKPWQVLACCMELNEAYKLEDPTKFISHIPVHQDGSCNGLQHYAALGGDVEGARQVNLVPADRPQDVYSHVAQAVRERVNKDAENGDKFAIFLKDKITRKVVKQTVMTNVYGVTFVGAREQIKKQIKHHFTPEENPSVYAHYLTTHVFASVRELFEGAHMIQDWLGEAARIISKSVRIDEDSDNPDKASHLSSVIWTTPLGLPCVQPYRATKTQVIKTNLQDVAITDPFGASPVDARKQKTALPPNFVHSLDATHMLMTASRCSRDNICFASVHDSYWTHASDIDQLSSNLREQFIKLHEDNLVSKVKEEFEARYEGFLQAVNIPREHELAKKIQEVRRNIVSSLGRAVTVADEIQLEKKRRELLASNDPEKIKAGRNLVTTVSVTEAYDISEIPQTVSGMPILTPIKFPAIPKKGDFDVNLVRNSTYFFS